MMASEWTVSTMSLTNATANSDKDNSFLQRNAESSSGLMTNNNNNVLVSSPTSPVHNSVRTVNVWPKYPSVSNAGNFLQHRHSCGSQIGNQKGGKTPDSKLAVIGSAAVGKSALVVRFITKRFIWEYDPTLECSYRYFGPVDDEQTCIEILDTAGQGDPYQQEGNFRWGEGFLLVYSITDRGSFENVSRLHESVVNVRRTTNISFVIVGNKSDLSHERKVAYSEGEQLAVDLGCAFVECSACDGDHEVYEAFRELHRDVVRRRSALGRRRRSSAQQVIQVFNKMFMKING